MLNVGARGIARLTVGVADSAIAAGSGDVPVLATPRLVALCEAAACAAVAAALEPGTTTVGIWIELDHLAASPLGRTVVAEAELADVDGRRLNFEISATDGEVVVARGRHRRQVVDRERFLAGLGPATPP